MTQEWMLTTLLELGFNQQEAEVYLFLEFDGALATFQHYHYPLHQHKLAKTLNLNLILFFRKHLLDYSSFMVPINASTPTMK
jgi:hypothetical protein